MVETSLTYRQPANTGLSPLQARTAADNVHITNVADAPKVWENMIMPAIEEAMYKGLYNIRVWNITAPDAVAKHGKSLGWRVTTDWRSDNMLEVKWEQVDSDPKSLWWTNPCFWVPLILVMGILGIIIF